MKAYLMFGAGTNGPYLTESVKVKENPLPHHKAGLSFTASGYGARIPTVYMVEWLKVWRRVYCRIYSNIGTLYIKDKQGRIVVRIDEE